jgi:hypothetical protein
LPSQEAIDALTPFLFEKTELFLHELLAFARSPLDIRAYDTVAQYDWPTRAEQRLPPIPPVVPQRRQSRSPSLSRRSYSSDRSSDDPYL